MSVFGDFGPHLFRMRENTDQNNSEYGHFSPSAYFESYSSTFTSWPSNVKHFIGEPLGETTYFEEMFSPLLDKSLGVTDVEVYHTI